MDDICFLANNLKIVTLQGVLNLLVMKNTIFFILAFVFVMGCTNVQDPEIITEIEVTEKSAENIVMANNAFAFDFLKEIDAAETQPNYMVSPLSLSLALGMAYNGAAGDTKKAFEQVLKYDAPKEVVNQFNKDLILALASTHTGSVMEIANSIWVEQTFPVKDNFKILNQTYYGAEVANLDFNAPESPDIINGWVSDKTHQKIPTIIDETKGYVLFLINALYFNASWMYQFDKDYTQKERFYTSSDSWQESDMMTMTEDVKYYANDLFSSVILPYENEKFSMVVLLPNQEYTCSDVIEQLDAEKWNAWMENFTTQEVSVKLPKFKMSYKNKLNDELINLGLGIAFSGSANFSDISDVAIFISFVLQKTFIDVKEEGTEAAAVTIIGFERTSVPSQPSPIFFNANRPFVYLIKDNATGSICFVGKVSAPEYEE